MMTAGTVPKRKDGSLPGPLDVGRWIAKGLPFLTGTERAMLETVLYTAPNREDGRVYVQIPLEHFRVVKTKRTNATQLSKRQARRCLRSVEAYGLLDTRPQFNAGSFYELRLDVIAQAYETTKRQKYEEKLALNKRIAQGSIPKHNEPRWLPGIGENEDRQLVGAMVEQVLTAVLRRVPNEPELRSHVKLVLKLWRDLDCPDASQLAADVELVVAAAKECKHWEMGWIRGENITGNARNATHARHDWTQRPSTILDPQKWSTRLELAKHHKHKDSACHCRHAVSGRMDAPEFKSDVELAMLARRRKQATDRLVPYFEVELGKVDPDLVNLLTPELRKQLVDETTYNQAWPLTITGGWREAAWQWLRDRGLLDTGPPK
jgi:hypothetical protein